MGSSITDIESGITKIEALIKALREDRDKARAEAADAKRLLDERELELLQMDEERQEERRVSDDRLSEAKQASENLEAKLTELAARIKNLMPLVAEYDDTDSNADVVRIPPYDRT
jgi:predicted  nucleic acid-binding Zn-ribbon protein